MDNEIEYIEEDAAQTIHQNISPVLRAKLTVEDIIDILDIEFEFQHSIGLTSESKPIVDYPIPVDEEKKLEYILKGCWEEGLELTREELLEVFEMEIIYLRKIGAIEDDGMSQHLN
ncbi:hypothetical protein [Rufibacter soli]